MSGALPDYVIVGAPKCGTSSLAKYLGDHPQAYMVPEKELRFFDQHFDEGLDWYRSRFAPADGELVGEATPSYLFEPGAIARMRSIIPRARLIALLREPVERAYSHYQHWHGRLGERRGFRAAVEPELALGRTTTSAGWDPERPEGYHYLARSRYRFQLERLCEHYPREQLHVIFFEDLEARPVEVFQDACRFLGIDPDAVPASVGEVVNPYRYYYPAWLWGLFVRVRIGRFLPGRAGAWLYRRMVRVAEPYPPLEDELRERLRAHFAPDNRELEQWLGRPLPQSWSR